jgi:hypothetical protein
MRSRTGVAFKSIVLAALSTAAIASPASASVTLGQLAPGNPPAICTSDDFDDIQPTVTSGNPYVVPGAGTIISWSHNATSVFPGTTPKLTMKIFRKVADPAVYQVVGHDGPRPLAIGLLNTFPASVPVKPGDVLGLNQAGPPGPQFGTACRFDVPGESFLSRGGNLADGQAAAFPPDAEARLNISAVFVPSNSFSAGKVKRNEKKGTATLTVNVPNPGELTGSGNGVKAASSGKAGTSNAVTTPGAAQLVIKAKGKKRRKLNETGKVKLNVNVTYAPTGGDPSTQLTKVKLKKNV